MARKEVKKARGACTSSARLRSVYGIHYYDHGRRRRERIRGRALAIAVREKRHTKIREGRYFPPVRRRAALFDNLLMDYRKAKEREGKEVQRGEYGYRRLLEELGGRRADITSCARHGSIARRAAENVAGRKRGADPADPHEPAPYDSRLMPRDECRCASNSCRSKKYGASEILTIKKYRGLSESLPAPKRRAIRWCTRSLITGHKVRKVTCFVKFFFF